MKRNRRTDEEEITEAFRKETEMTSPGVMNYMAEHIDSIQVDPPQATSSKVPYSDFWEKVYARASFAFHFQGDKIPLSLRREIKNAMEAGIARKELDPDQVSLLGMGAVDAISFGFIFVEWNNRQAAPSDFGVDPQLFKEIFEEGNWQLKEDEEAVLIAEESTKMEGSHSAGDIEGHYGPGASDDMGVGNHGEAGLVSLDDAWVQLSDLGRTEKCFSIEEFSAIADLRVAYGLFEGNAEKFAERPVLELGYVSCRGLFRAFAEANPEGISPQAFNYLLGGGWSPWLEDDAGSVAEASRIALPVLEMRSKKPFNTDALRAFPEFLPLVKYLLENGRGVAGWEPKWVAGASILAAFDGRVPRRLVGTFSDENNWPAVQEDEEREKAQKKEVVTPGHTEKNKKSTASMPRAIRPLVLKKDDELLSYEETLGKVPQDNLFDPMQFFGHGFTQIQDILLKITGMATSTGLANASNRKNSKIRLTVGQFGAHIKLERGAIIEDGRRVDAGLTREEWAVFKVKDRYNADSDYQWLSDEETWQDKKNGTRKRNIRGRSLENVSAKGKSYEAISGLYDNAQELLETLESHVAEGVIETLEETLKFGKSKEEYAAPVIKQGKAGWESPEKSAWLVAGHPVVTGDAYGLGTVMRVVLGPGCRQDFGVDLGLGETEPTGSTELYLWVAGHILNADFGLPGHAPNITGLTSVANARHKTWEKEIKSYCQEKLAPFYGLLERNFDIDINELGFGLEVTVSVDEMSWREMFGSSDESWGEVSGFLICESRRVRVPVGSQAFAPYFRERHSGETSQAYEAARGRCLEALEDALQKTETTPENLFLSNLPEGSKMHWAGPEAVRRKKEFLDKKARERKRRGDEFGYTRFGEKGH